VTATPELRLLAEEMFFVIPPPPGGNRVVTERYVLHMPASAGSPVAFNNVGRLRLRTDEAEAVIAEVRERFAERGKTSVTWWVSAGATPGDLAERLRARGAVPLDDPSAEPRYAAMVLTQEPGAAPAGLGARRVRNVDEFRLATELFWEATGVLEEHRERGRSRMDEYYEKRHVSGESVSYLAWVAGEPAATAFASLRPEGAALNGAATLPEFRGRGAYRALVRARWEDAAARGAPALAVQAGAMSRPILEHVGFTSLGDVEVLYDGFAG
jgi:GNAT superfamily N-acetyltransferase